MTPAKSMRPRGGAPKAMRMIPAADMTARWQNGTGFVAGHDGQAFSFDGVDDQILVPHAVTLDFVSHATIAAWVNRTTSGHGWPILQKRTTANVGYTFETTHNPHGPSNGLQWVLWIDGVQHLLMTPPDVLKIGEWQHVAATYDGATMRIYVDGVERACEGDHRHGGCHARAGHHRP